MERFWKCARVNPSSGCKQVIRGEITRSHAESGRASQATRHSPSDAGTTASCWISPSWFFERLEPGTNFELCNAFAGAEVNAFAFAKV